LGHANKAMFEDVYSNMPFHLREQLRELDSKVTAQPAEQTILSFEDEMKRAVG
jgi:hypothetical protein